MSDHEVDADIDEELLALAGDSDDDAQHEVDDGKSRSPTPPPASSSPHQPAESSTPQKRAAPKKRTSTSMKPTTGRRRKDSSGDEREPSTAPTSPNSLGSGAMSESEDDAPASEPAGDGAQYAYEGLWESAAEKNRVMSLPEIQRENFIADRREEVHRRKQDAEIQKLAALTKAESEKQDSRAAKRKAGGDVEDGQRKSRKVQQSERLDSYKRQREQRHQQRTRDSDRRNRDRSSDSSRHSDADAEGESDVEYDQPRAAPARGDPPCTLDDLRKAKVGRTNFAMVCHYPKFEEAITGCWARVCIGPNRETGQSIYRMAEVKGFKEGRPYQIQTHDGKSVWTEQYAILAHGKLEKTWPFSACSESAITEAELDRYKSACSTDGLRIPTKSDVDAKVEDINSLLNTSWDNHNIDYRVKKQNQVKDKAMKAKAEAPHITTTEQARNDRIANLNKERRKKDSEEIRAALLRERREAREKQERERKRKMEQAAAAKHLAPGNIDDLFDGSDISRTGTPLNIKKSPKKPASPNGAQPQKPKGIPTFSKRTMEEDIIGSIDIEIDIDI